MSCSQLVEIEDLVLGTIEPARARDLRLHVEGCTACRREHAVVTKERALFADREPAVEELPPTIGLALRAQLTAEARESGASRARMSISGTHVGPARRGATRLVRRGASALGQVLRRGHVSAACAAVLFAFVAFSRLGGAPILPAASADAADSEPSGPSASGFGQSLASEESLACTQGNPMSMFASDAVVSSGGAAQFSRREMPVCGSGNDRSGASCEPSVTCSWLRQ